MATHHGDSAADMREQRRRSGSSTVRRQALQATRDRAHVAGGETKAWTAWQRAVIEAESALKAALGDALHDMEETFALAGHFWDKALADARLVTEQIEDPARQYLERALEAARQARGAILDPASEAYDRAISEAHDQFTKTVDLAERAYQAELADADRVKSLGATLTEAS